MEHFQLTTGMIRFTPGGGPFPTQQFGLALLFFLFVFFIAILGHTMQNHFVLLLISVNTHKTPSVVMQPLVPDGATRKRCDFHTDAARAFGATRGGHHPLLPLPLQGVTLAPPPLSPWLSCIDRRSTYNLIFHLLISLLPSPPAEAASCQRGRRGDQWEPCLSRGRSRAGVAR